mgnify:FL=1
MRGNDRHWFYFFRNHISIHASTREATYASKADKTTADISIHASTWEATGLSFRFSFAWSISIHASTWEATYKRGTPCICVLISIHASTWEATHSVSHSQGRYLLFQFTPLHERQRTWDGVSKYTKKFQFTPLHERQLTEVLVPGEDEEISIHASTWEATSIPHTIALRIQFQFMPLHERQLLSTTPR